MTPEVFDSIAHKANELYQKQEHRDESLLYWYAKVAYENGFNDGWQKGYDYGFYDI